MKTTKTKQRLPKDKQAKLKNKKVKLLRILVLKTRLEQE